MDKSTPTPEGRKHSQADSAAIDAGSPANLDDSYINELDGRAEDEALAAEVFAGRDVMRFERTIDSRFTIVPNELTDLRSPYHVDHAAAGCWVHMMALGRSWRFNVKGFVTICDDGELKVQTQLKALEAKGWVLCFRRRDRGRWAPGTLWLTLDDPRRAPAQVELYESMGLTLYSKLETVIEKPQVATVSGKPRYGCDQGIVENSSSVENLVVENSADGSDFSENGQQNTRSQPYLEKPYLENQALYKNINNKKYKNPNSEAIQRSDSPRPEDVREPESQSPSESPAAAPIATKESRAAPAALGGDAARPFSDAEKNEMRETFDAMQAAAPGAVPEDESVRAKIAFSEAVRAGHSPAALADAWRAFAADAEQGGTTLLPFLEDEGLIAEWERRASERPPASAETKPARHAAQAPRSPEPDRDDAGFAELVALYPKPARGGAEQAARESYAQLLAEGMGRKDLLAAARAYAEQMLEEGRDMRYVMSLATFLAEPKGAKRWAQVAGRRSEASGALDIERKRKQVKRALDNVSCARKAELVVEFADQSGDEGLRDAAGRLRADGSDARMHARLSYPALERRVTGREHNREWVEWVHSLLVDGAPACQAAGDPFEEADAVGAKA